MTCSPPVAPPSSVWMLLPPFGREEWELTQEGRYTGKRRPYACQGGIGREERNSRWCLWPSPGPPSLQVCTSPLCLSLMVGSLLETIFITHLLHVATTYPPALPRWLHSLLLHCTSRGRCCPTAPQKGNKGLGLTPTHLPGEGSHTSPSPTSTSLLLPPSLSPSLYR